MDKTFHISVKNKRAKNLTNMRYVCENSDYIAVFAFDDDWDAYPVKTVRFVEANGTPVDVIMEGNTCAIPRFRDTFRIEVGVYAGNIRTSTAAIIEAERAITSKGGLPADPQPDVYAQIMEKLNELEHGVGGLSASLTVDENGDNTLMLENKQGSSGAGLIEDDNGDYTLTL